MLLANFASSLHPAVIQSISYIAKSDRAAFVLQVFSHGTDCARSPKLFSHMQQANVEAY